MKSHRFLLVFWLSAAVGALVLLYGLFPPGDSRALLDAALGEQTKTVIGRLGSNRVHCFTMVDGEECLAPARERALGRHYLWLGNSQLHAINQLRAGDELMSVQVARALRGEDIDLLTFSQPNANLQEHLVLFTAISDLWPVHLLILPVVFDDTRESGIRFAILSTVQQPRVSEKLSTSDIGRAIVAMGKERSNGRETVQQLSENAITLMMDKAFGWENLRSRARGAISLSLYVFRNSVFGITPSTIRRSIPATYETNIAALKQILAMAAASETRVILYIPPLRSDVPRPYDAQEYSVFLATAKILAADYGAYFANLENLVPGPFWGLKDATSIGGQPELDFMHFKAMGHNLMAKRILEEIRNSTDGF